MNEKPVPEFMMRYMENIGYECFDDYERLSLQYHREVDHYHQKIHPGKVEMSNLYSRIKGIRPNLTGNRELYEIDERFKAKALETGCKYGYNSIEESQSISDGDLTKAQNHSAFSNVLNKDDFDLSPEDKRARSAHSEFEERKGITTEARRYERELIELHYGENRNQKLVTDSKHAERYLSSLSSEKQIPPVEKEEPTPIKTMSADRSRFENKLNDFRAAKEEITTHESELNRSAKQPEKEIDLKKEREWELLVDQWELEHEQKAKQESEPENRFMNTLSSERLDQEDPSLDNRSNEDLSYGHFLEHGQVRSEKDIREDIDMDR